MIDMKRCLIWMLVVAVMAVVTACSLDELPTEKVEPKEEVGYLLLRDFVIVGDTENKENEDEIETGTGNAKSGTTRTRAGEEALPEAPDTYVIQILNSKNEVAWNGTYAEAKSQRIPLEPGMYTVWAYQDSNKGPAQGVAVDAPYYAGSSTVEIKSEQEASVEVTCRLFNIRVTVELSADLKDMFKVYDAGTENRLMTKVTIGDGNTDETGENYSYTFEKDANHDSPFVYYKSVAGLENVMEIKLTGDFYTGPVEEIYTRDAFKPENEAKWKFVTMTKKVVGSDNAPLTGGQWRQISIDIEHNDEGNAQFIFTIDDYVYDKTITVSTMKMYGEVVSNLKQEEAIPEDDVNDPMAPQVKIVGVTPDEDGVYNYAITPDMIDSAVSNGSNDWTSNLKAKVSIPEGSTATLKSLYVEFKESTNAQLLAALDASTVYHDRMIPIYPNNGASDYVNITEENTMYALKDKGMDAIYNYEGTHVIRIHTVGSNDLLGFADVRITVSKAASAGPKVVWMVAGEAVDKGITISLGNLPGSVIANITSNGLTGLKVKIESAVLKPEDLAEVGLQAEMDLLNPGELEAALTALGFLPLNDPEEDPYLKDIEFNITNFMPALASLEKGASTFIIIATEGSKTVEVPFTITVE